ncbi:hypothetical protein AA309_15620 [Microvirga vignae]|uniref:Uncharacterized protein n=1 Tax=Microvirga vignae TaxID=1225564 RepID=A0A0H1RHY2_9HYPH|nr:hypothetical protein AA309_15620 [Microvirga vignae]
MVIGIKISGSPKRNEVRDEEKPDDADAKALLLQPPALLNHRLRRLQDQSDKRDREDAHR